MSAAEKWVTTQKLEAVITEQEGEGGVNWLSDCLEENRRWERRNRKEEWGWVLNERGGKMMECEKGGGQKKKQRHEESVRWKKELAGWQTGLLSWQMMTDAEWESSVAKVDSWLAEVRKRGREWRRGRAERRISLSSAEKGRFMTDNNKSRDGYVASGSRLVSDGVYSHTVCQWAERIVGKDCDIFRN